MVVEGRLIDFVTYDTAGSVDRNSGWTLLNETTAILSIIGHMAAKFQASNEYTTSESLALAKEMRARILAGYQTYQVALPGGGTQMKTLPPLSDVEASIRALQQQLDLENAEGDITSRPVNYARMTRRI